jgi:hypothetical protein
MQKRTVSKSVGMQSIDLVKTMNWGLFWGIQKGTVSEKCWIVVSTADENTMKWGLFEECKK